MVDIFDSHDSQFVADDDLPHIVTPTAQIIADIKQKLSSWLDELDNHVPLDTLKLEADAIIGAIKQASAWPSANDLAIELAVMLDSRFEQIGLGKTWYNTLMFLSGAPNADNELFLARLWQCLLRYYLSCGETRCASQAIKLLLDIAESNADAPLKEAMLAQVRISAVISGDTDSADLAENLLALAEITQDLSLMSQVYATRAFYYANEWDALRTYENAQMAFAIGYQLGDIKLIADGLHHMASAFQVAKDEQLAAKYLNQAVDYCQETGQTLRLSWLTYVQGANYYNAKKYLMASEEFKKCIDLFKADRGGHYAQSLYMLGLSLMQMDRFTEAHDNLEQARHAYLNISRDFEVNYVDHAIAAMYAKQGLCEEAVALAEKVLARTRQSEDHRAEALGKILEKDIDDYRCKNPNQIIVRA